MPTPRIVALIVFAAVTVGILAQESTSYRMDRITLASTANSVSSASYAMTVTFAQEGPVGSSSRCNDSFLQSTGYWSILGETPVPVFLLIDKNDVDAELPDLIWTGSASEFTVYRSEMRDDVVDPMHDVITTPLCAATDASPPSPIAYYLVVPTGN